MTTKDQQFSEQIEAAYNTMLSKCMRTFTEEQKGNIRRAFLLAKEAHKNAARKSGEPYILHPIAVAQIVGQEIGLGERSVMAALLHDVVEDSHYTVNDIRSMFDDTVAYLVEGLTKIRNVIDVDSNQAETYKHLIIAMSNDIRVVFIKLADRLHNMRTLSSMPEHKRDKIVSETAYFYAPLAYRIGLYLIKSELEELVMRYRNPLEYEQIKQYINQTVEEREQSIQAAKEKIESILDKQKYNYEITGRVKSVASIFHKMQTQQRNLSEVLDIYALRIILTPKSIDAEKEECYEVYRTITRHYHQHPGRDRDWIKTPKSNGYEALHTTVMIDKWVEIQIRSQRMNLIADYGMATHCRYKGVIERPTLLENWLRNITEMLTHNDSNAIDLVEDFQASLITKNITVFTPKGREIVLPKQSSALDFAFAIHSSIGLSAIAAKINWKLSPLSHILENGDQVEIITSSQQKPQEQWLAFVVTHKAKRELLMQFKSEDNYLKSKVSKGKQLFKEFVAKKEIKPTVTFFNSLLKYFKLDNVEEFYLKLGNEEIPPEEIEKVLRSNWRIFRKWIVGIIATPFTVFGSNKQTLAYLVLCDPAFKGYLYYTANCCNPQLGSDNISVIEENKSIVIHHKNCRIAQNIVTEKQNKITTTQLLNYKLDHACHPTTQDEPVVIESKGIITVHKGDCEMLNALKENADAKRLSALWVKSPRPLSFYPAQCCKPIPGDEITAFSEPRNRIAIHKKGCTVAMKLAAEHGDRILPVKWHRRKEDRFIVKIELEGFDQTGMVNKITKILSQDYDANIHRINVGVENSIFKGFIELYVSDKSMLDKIMDALKSVDGMYQVKREE